jgi:hypothetical protein
MKADAVEWARGQGQKPSTVYKMVINDRDQLAFALNMIAYVSHEAIAPVEVNKLPALLRETGEDDWVPSFIRADWERRRKARASI